MIYSDFLVEMRLPSFGERSLQIYFFVEICLRYFLQTLFFKDSLVEVSSEICFVGISLQRMVNMSLQRVLWEIIPSLVLVENVSSQILCPFSQILLARKMSLETFW